jgi:hypothetical protein
MKTNPMFDVKRLDEELGKGRWSLVFGNMIVQST